jgi:hypothetical protein
MGAPAGAQCIAWCYLLIRYSTGAAAAWWQQILAQAEVCMGHPDQRAALRGRAAFAGPTHAVSDKVSEVSNYRW